MVTLSCRVTAICVMVRIACEASFAGTRRRPWHRIGNGNRRRLFANRHRRHIRGRRERIKGAVRDDDRLFVDGRRGSYFRLPSRREISPADPGESKRCQQYTKQDYAAQGYAWPPLSMCRTYASALDSSDCAGLPRASKVHLCALLPIARAFLSTDALGASILRAARRDTSDPSQREASMKLKTLAVFGLCMLTAMLFLVSTKSEGQAVVVAKTKEQAIEDLVYANRILYNEGVLDAFGHISVRDPTDPTHFFMSKGNAPSLVTKADIIRYDMQCVAEGPSRTSVTAKSTFTAACCATGRT